MKRGCLVALALLVMSSPAAAQKKIVIDPGHGGTDPGGVGTGLQEKNVVLDTSSRFRDLLQADTADTAGGGAWTVSMTRSTDVFVSLSARASYANSMGADRFMSIHSNAFGDPSANGTETFSYQNGTTSAALRNLVQEEMIAAWGLRDRGNKTANFAVLRETAMPAVLHELAFITNATDAAKLASGAERQKAAEAHLRAIQRHFGIAPYIPGDGTPEPPPPTGAVEGLVSGPDGPIAGAAITLDGEAVADAGPAGEFQMNDVANGEHVVGATAPGYLPAEQMITVEGGQIAGVDLFLEPDTSDVGNDDDDDPSDPGDDDPIDENDPTRVTGGCQVAAGGDSGAPVWLALVCAALWHRRRRRAA